MCLSIYRAFENLLRMNWWFWWQRGWWRLWKIWLQRWFWWQDWKRAMAKTSSWQLWPGYDPIMTKMILMTRLKKSHGKDIKLTIMTLLWPHYDPIMTQLRPKYDPIMTQSWPNYDLITTQLWPDPASPGPPWILARVVASSTWWSTEWLSHIIIMKVKRNDFCTHLLWLSTALSLSTFFMDKHNHERESEPFLYFFLSGSRQRSRHETCRSKWCNQQNHEYDHHHKHDKNMIKIKNQTF